MIDCSSYGRLTLFDQAFCPSNQQSSFGLLWFCIRRRASRMADCSFEIFCESDQKIRKLKSYKQLKEKSKSVLSSEDFKEQHINCEERKCF